MTDQSTTLTIRTGPALMLGGGALIALGAFLPWVSVRHIFGSTGFAGIEGDGRFALLLGVALAIGGWQQLRARQHIRWPGVVAILTAGFVVVEMLLVGFNISEGSNEYAHASLGVGLYVVALGAVAAVVGAFKARSELS